MRTFITVAVMCFFSSYLNAQEKEIDSLIQQAFHRLALKDYVGSIDAFNNAVQLRPDDITLYLARAYAKNIIKQYNEALGDVYLAFLIDNKSAETYYMRGCIKKNMLKYDEAISDFSKALEIKADHFDAVKERIDTYLLLGRYDKALASVDYYLTRYPTNGDFYYLKAIVYHEMGKIDDALQNFETATVFKTRHDSSRYMIASAQAKIKMNSLLEAKAYLDKSLSINPQEVGAYYARGIIYYELGQTEKALHDFSAAITLINPDEDRYWEYIQRDRYAVIADTITYDVVVKNPDTTDSYMQESLKYLRKDNMIDYIFKAIYEGKIIPFDYYNNAAVSIEKIRQMEQEFIRSRIGMIKFREKWFFDKDRFAMQKKNESYPLCLWIRDTR